MQYRRLLYLSQYPLSGILLNTAYRMLNVEIDA